MHTILITGGHHNSALVVAKEIVKRGSHVVWVGHRHSSRGDSSDSAEYIEVNAAKIPFHDLLAGKLVLDLKELMRFPLGIIQSLQILRQLRPTAILSFGGYLGGSVALAGKLLHIPIYLHEQTITAGRANKLIGNLAQKIYLTWPQSAKYFAKSKTKVVGLPLRENLLKAQRVNLFNRKKPILLVMGGKQGAHSLNQFIFHQLNNLLMDYNIIHQTGTNSQTRDYEHAESLKNGLGSLSDCYLPLGYIGESEIGKYLRSADLYLGRSGAHICYELAVLGLPSVLVPLMSTHDAEQLKNAKVLVDAQLGLILNQKDLNLSNFIDITTRLKKLKGHSLKLEVNASSALVDDLLLELK